MTVVVRSATRRRTVARAMSEPSPRTRTVCTEPIASLILWSSGEIEAAVEVRVHCVVRVEPVADLAPLVQPGIHGGQQFGPQPRVLGQVDAAAGSGDLFIE